MNCGIYKLINTETGDCYIGQSVSLKKRKQQHFRSLQIGNHKNMHLQSAYNKYGMEWLSFEILLYCEKANLTYYEQTLVDGLRPHYNIRKECVDSQKGKFVTDETRRRLSESHKGKKLSEAQKQKISDANMGRIVSDETRRKISESNNGKSLSEEHKQKLCKARRKRVTLQSTRLKISLAGMGRSPTKETRLKLSIANSGKVPSDESKRKLSEAHKGKLHSVETRRRMSESQKLGWAKRRMSQCPLEELQ